MLEEGGKAAAALVIHQQFVSAVYSAAERWHVGAASLTHLKVITIKQLCRLYSRQGLNQNCNTVMCAAQLVALT